MSRWLSSLLAFALVGFLNVPCWAQPTRVFRAGAATTNITPPLGELIVGGWAPLPADEVHDELHARALVLDDGETKLALVIVDSVGVSREVFEAAYTQVEQTTGIPRHCQLFAATHTHSASSSRSENAMVTSATLASYQAFLATRIADAVRIAHKRLAPARIGWGSVEEPSELFNRRWYVVEESERRNPFGGIDQVRMNPGSNSTLIRPAGPIDPEVSFISVQTADGSPLCVLANYSLHYVGGVPARVISADYFAVFANKIAELLKVQDQSPSFVGILSNGTSGDVNNINFSQRGPAYKSFEKMRIVGEKVAGRVYAALSSVEYHDWVELRGARSELELAVRRPDEKLLAYMQAVEAKPEGEKPYQAHEKTYAKRVQQLAQSPEKVMVPLQVLRIGELGIAAIPFEVFTETGLELKAACPLSDCFTIELAGGSFGYLPTPAQHAVGGYETWMGTSKVEVTASDKIRDRLLKLFAEVK
jgi:neutral ceramidase